MIRAMGAGLSDLPGWESVRPRRPRPPYALSVAYDVRTRVYEGPFELLLHLILRDQVDLYEVSLSEIVDAYIAELARMERCDLEVATEFLLIAATLIELKSRRLLPIDSDVALDEELAVWEERDLLLAKLLECKTFKDAAVALRGMADAAGRSRPRTAGPEERFADLIPDVLEGVTPPDLRRAYLDAVAPSPVPRIDLDHVAPIRASVTDAVRELFDELPRRGRTTFRALTSDISDRIQVVVRFLAILELFKDGWCDLTQPETFGDIEITWLGREDTETVDLATVDLYEG